MKSDPEANNLPDPSASMPPDNGQETELRAECERLRRRVAELEAERERDRARLAQAEHERDFLGEVASDWATQVALLRPVPDEEEVKRAIEQEQWCTIEDIIADLERSAKESQA